MIKNNSKTTQITDFESYLTYNIHLKDEDYPKKHFRIS